MPGPLEPPALIDLFAAGSEVVGPLDIEQLTIFAGLGCLCHCGGERNNGEAIQVCEIDCRWQMAGSGASFKAIAGLRASICRFFCKKNFQWCMLSFLLASTMLKVHRCVRRSTTSVVAASTYYLFVAFLVRQEVMRTIVSQTLYSCRILEYSQIPTTSPFRIYSVHVSCDVAPTFVCSRSLSLSITRLTC